jgi:hypothetical protein
MIVWGGGYPGGHVVSAFWYGDGGIYDPATDSWATMTSAGSPAPRELMAGAGTDDKFFAWGGREENSGPKASVKPVLMAASYNYLSTGGVYDPNGIPPSRTGGGGGGGCGFLGMEALLLLALAAGARRTFTGH